MIDSTAKKAMTIKEAARTYSVSRSTLYGLLKQGRIKDTKIAGRRLVLVSDLDRLLGVEAWDAQGKFPGASREPLDRRARLREVQTLPRQDGRGG